MWGKGDDLGVLTDNDEAGFRAVQYGRGRKVMLPDSVNVKFRWADYYPTCAAEELDNTPSRGRLPQNSSSVLHVDFGCN